MQIHQLVKTALTEHKQKIELTQWAIIAGISSLFYSEYISKMKRKETPVKCVMVPSLKNLSKYFRPDSEFMEHLSNNLIIDIAYNYSIQKYSNAPELIMFNEDNIEIMKTIYDLYIAPNITRRIPETIAKKFGLNNETQQFFRESWDIDLFEGNNISKDHYHYIVDQIVLQLLMLLPTMKKEVTIPESNFQINMSKNEILSIANENAICPIHFSPMIIENKSVIELLSFVTNTSITSNIISNNYSITTGITNQVSLTKLNGIELE